MHDSEKENDHYDVHDDDSDVLITSVEGPSCSTTGKQLNIVTFAVNFKPTESLTEFMQFVI